MPAALLLTALVFAAAAAAAAPPSRSPAQPQRIRLAQGQSSAILQGRFEPGAEGVDYWQEYMVAAKSGQRLKVRLTSADPGAWLAVYCPGGGSSGALLAREVSFTVPQSGDYIVRIEGDFDRPHAFAYSVAVGVMGTPKPIVPEGVGGHYEGDSGDVEVRQLPDGKLEVLVSAYKFLPPPSGTDIAPHMGVAHGVVPVAQGSAKLAPTEKCTLTMHFTPNRLSIEQQGSDHDCRFGFGVTAAGDYRRTSLCAEPQLDVP